MRVLFITGGFAGPGRQPWLMDDLADALATAGHTVDVIVGDAKNPRPRGEQRSGTSGLTVFSVGAARRLHGRLGKLVSHLSVGIGLHTIGYQWARQRQYDLCIFTSPASFSWGLPGRIRRSGIARHTLLFLWDFFPIHQLEIGRINLPGLAPIMKWTERRAIKSADTVALMSPANTKFFRNYHRGARNQTVEIPPWSSKKPAAPVGKPSSPLTVIFGGQIAKGRGVDTLVESAAILSRREAPVRIVVAGNGPDRAMLQREAEERGLDNIEFVGSLPRERYHDLARRAHAGVAITVSGVTPPSFPSKIVEYCSLGLPVLVCVEASSDAGQIVESSNAGLSIPVGDATALATAMQTLHKMHDDGRLTTMSEAAVRLFESDFAVDRAVEMIESAVHAQGISDPDGAP